MATGVDPFSVRERIDGRGSSARRRQSPNKKSQRVASWSPEMESLRGDPVARREKKMETVSRGFKGVTETFSVRGRIRRVAEFVHGFAAKGLDLCDKNANEILSTYFMP